MQEVNLFVFFSFSSYFSIDYRYYKFWCCVCLYRQV